MAERSEKLEAEFEMRRSLVWPQPAGALLQGESRSRRVCEQAAVRICKDVEGGSDPRAPAW